MFSAILMAAMATSTTAPDFFCKPRCAPVCAPVVCCKPVVVYSCNGCYGSCNGCYGSCYGSCYGGCYGSCYGSCYGGCYGSCYGSCYGCYGSVVVPTTPIYKGKAQGAPQAAPVAPAAPKNADDMKKKPAAQAAPARVIVEMQANAKLFVDGVATEATGARRVFSTPALAQGSAFFYDIKVVNADNTVRTTKLVVRAGEDAVANFENESTASR